MREIKFRAWDEYEGKMVCHKELFDREFVNSCDEEVFVDDKIVLMQFTGLHDKNGKEIYEGDIVLVEDEYVQPITDDGRGPSEPFNHLCPVIFKEGGFCVEFKEKGTVWWGGYAHLGNEDLEEVEVIGNIYQNPELLTEVKE